MITFIAGLALVIQGRPEHVHLRPRDMYLLTVSSWLVVCIFAALPFLLTQHISYTDAFFESMSGITATSHGAQRPGHYVARHSDVAFAPALARRHRLYRHGGSHFATAAHRWHAPVPDRVLGPFPKKSCRARTWLPSPSLPST